MLVLRFGKRGNAVAIQTVFRRYELKYLLTLSQKEAIARAMGTGLIAGMGYLGFAALFAVIMCVGFLALGMLTKRGEQAEAACKTVKITIPEDLDYTGVFEDIFAQYATEHTLVQVRTTNMGSMFRLTYDIMLKDAGKEKEMIDRIRTRNGNLEVLVSRQERAVAEL